MHGYAAFTDTGDDITGSNWSQVANLDRPVMFITPFLPKVIFGNFVTFDEIVLFSYGIDTKMKAFLTKITKRISFYTETNQGSHMKGVFLKKGEECWIIHTTANMTTGCIECCYNIYFRKKINVEPWGELMNTYARYYQDSNDSSMYIIKEEDSFFVCGRNVVPFILNNSENVICATNYTAMSFIRRYRERIKRVYFSNTTDITKVWESGEWVVPAIEHRVTNHIKMYRGMNYCAFGSANASTQSMANAEVLYITNNRHIYNKVLEFEKLLSSMIY